METNNKDLEIEALERVIKIQEKHINTMTEAIEQAQLLIETQRRIIGYWENGEVKV